MYGEGISREGGVIDLAVTKEILEKSGTWFSYRGERIGQGRENPKQFLKENKDTMTKLEAELRKELGLTKLAVFYPPPLPPHQKHAATAVHRKAAQAAAN